MDFSKIDGFLKPNERNGGTGKIRKNKDENISFSDIFSEDKKTYTLPSLGETSIFSGSDHATISESAKTAYYLSKIKAMVANIPDTRDKKIKDAIELLKEGLDNPKITNEIARRIADMFSLK